MIRKRTLPLLAALLLSGCTVGPNFEQPPPPNATGYAPGALAPMPRGKDAQRFLAGRNVDAQWWRQFGSVRLDALVEQGLASNPDLDGARAALRGAQESVKAQQGFYYPTVAAGLSVNPRRDATGTLASLQVNNQTYFTLFSPQLGISYAPDVFGMNHRAVESLEAQAESQCYLAEATYNTLISNIVAAAIRKAMLTDMVTSAQAQVEQDHAILALLRRQQTMGQVSEADLSAQQTALAQSEAALPPLQVQMGIQDNLLASLVGKFPSDRLENGFTTKDFTLPRDMPVSLPAHLVEQRPDVRAAQAQLHAASANVGVAVAARLPNISLTAGIGTVSTAFSSLFAPENLFWSLAASAGQTLFDGGTLEHRQKAAEASLDVAKAQYRRVVINALQDVADTLTALAHDTLAVDAAHQSADAASRSLDLTLRRQKMGAASTLALLNARKTVAAAQNGLIQAQANRLQDSAALFMALGGGQHVPVGDTKPCGPPSSLRL
jgi:NodT family efflux transporter outer membrane factor (OMF) lipoprotein